MREISLIRYTPVGSEYQKIVSGLDQGGPFTSNVMRVLRIAASLRKPMHALPEHEPWTEPVELRYRSGESTMKNYEKRRDKEGEPAGPQPCAAAVAGGHRPWDGPAVHRDRERLE